MAGTLWGVDIPDFNNLDEWSDWYNENWGKLTAAQQAKYEPYLTKLKDLIGYDPTTGAWDESKWPTYTPIAWEGSDWQKEYETEKGNLDTLLSKIQTGATTEDETAAMATIAARYGMTEASWTAMQDSILDATGVIAKASEIATTPTAYTEAQDKASRVALRTTTEAVAKQVEAIFGEKGTSAGFAAAYELTSQMQSDYLASESARQLEYLDRAIAAVNDQNDYYQNLISTGAIEAADYIEWRFDQLQTAYTDTLTSMQETYNNWLSLETVNQEQAKLQSDLLAQQINAIVDIMNAEMGVDQQTLDMLASVMENLPAPEETDNWWDTLSSIGEEIGGTWSLVLDCLDMQ